jgi:hypothetical protein
MPDELEEKHKNERQHEGDEASFVIHPCLVTAR